MAVRRECFAGVERSLTVAIFLWRICDVKIRIAFEGSLNRAYPTVVMRETSERHPLYP